MIELFDNKYSLFRDYILGKNKPQLSKDIALPNYPYFSAFLIFVVTGSKVVGESVSIILLLLVVLIDIKWWLRFIIKSAIIVHPLRWLLLVIIIGVGLSSYTSLSNNISWYRFFTSLAITWIAVGTFEFLSRLDYRTWLPILVKVFVVFSTIIFLKQFATNVEVKNPDTVTYLCWAVVCLLPTLIYCIKHNISKWYSWFIVITIFLSALHLESRATLVGYVLVALTYFIFINKNNALKPYHIILALVIATLILYFGFFHKAELFSNVQGEQFLPKWLIDPVRQATWRFAWEAIPSMPIFGFGIEASNNIPGAREIVPWLFIPPLYYKAGIMEYLPHNVLLQWLLELGWITFSLIMLLYVIIFIKLLFEKDEIRKYELMLHAGYFGISLINSNFWTSFWVISYVFSIAILYALSESKKLYH